MPAVKLRVLLMQHGRPTTQHPVPPIQHRCSAWSGRCLPIPSSAQSHRPLSCGCRVKFRDDEELQVLTVNRQSGGERSVSTMMYLISIQVGRTFKEKMIWLLKLA